MKSYHWWRRKKSPSTML